MSHHDSECVVAQVGSPAPDFTMASTRNLETLDQPVKLADYRGKWLVMFFYPLDFTFVCPTEITAFSDAASKFRAAGAEILGVSVDSQFTHRAWIKTPRDKNGLGELNFPLAAEMLRGVVFFDAGTVNRELEVGTIRTSVGFGFRLTLPFFGQVPIALDFVFPITKDDQDEKRFFSFSLGLGQ